ncbi:unnamed protein product [Allacma fusca]|uniref:Tc1-like transposase DDE domain-containing protein n=1 Tax=Allacma fusca TaxID=39272 RepID=A0A8J2P988_9HEXA|nr:unnamed protein product [Allacma fusca]
MYCNRWDRLVAFVIIFCSTAIALPGRIKPRNMHGNCEILINEIVLQEGAYVEVAKLCPSNTQQQNKRTDLNGFVLVLMNSNGVNLTFEKVTQLDAVELLLSNVTFSSNSKTFRHGSRPTGGIQSGFKVGTNESTSTVKSNSTESLALPEEPRQTNAKYFRVININGTRFNTTTAIMLLHQNAQERRRAILYKVNQIVTDELLAKLQAEVHDAVVIAGMNDNMNHKIMFLGHNKQPLRSLVWPDAEDFSINFGISKCDADKKPFNPQGFKYSLKSPQSPNYCNPHVKYMLEESEYIPPFGPFSGRLIGTQALQLSINLVRSLQNAKNRQKLFQMEPKKLAAKLLNIGLRTVYRAEKQLEETGTIEREYKRKPFESVMSNLNDEIRAILYETITSFYQQNLVPTLQPIFNRFLSYIQRDNVTVKMGNVSKLFTCGFKTFRKILKIEDYKFGRINHRDAVLLNPDKVAWRGRYLRRIRNNDKDQNYTFCLFYMSTADTHAVIEKSWVRSCYASLQERRDFSLKNYKPGKGRRLIIVAAGNENGFIEESIFVKKIAKGASEAQDYHDNINAESFRKWFFELLDILDRISSKKFLIVMDNAPSHSEVTIKSGANKQEMITWIQQQKDRGYPVNDGFESLRNWELQEIIKNLKTLAPHHKLDQYARERGHEIVRIPPYQCELNPIEEVWKDIKQERIEKAEYRSKYQ